MSIVMKRLWWQWRRNPLPLLLLFLIPLATLLVLKWGIIEQEEKRNSPRVSRFETLAEARDQIQAGQIEAALVEHSPMFIVVARDDEQLLQAAMSKFYRQYEESLPTYETIVLQVKQAPQQLQKALILLFTICFFIFNYLLSRAVFRERMAQLLMRQWITPLARRSWLHGYMLTYALAAIYMAILLSFASYYLFPNERYLFSPLGMHLALLLMAATPFSIWLGLTIRSSFHLAEALLIVVIAPYALELFNVPYSRYVMPQYVMATAVQQSLSLPIWLGNMALFFSLFYLLVQQKLKTMYR